MILMLNFLIHFHFLANAVESRELRFDDKIYKMKQIQISREIFSSEITVGKLKVLWTKMESLEPYDIMKVCRSPRSALNLKLKTRVVNSCLEKDGVVSFATQSYQKIKFYHIHHFRFPAGTSAKEITSFFADVTYETQVK